MTEAIATTPELDRDQTRFMKYVEKDATSGCWLWTGSTAITGYSNFFYKGRVYLAHRAALLVFGKVKQLNPAMVVSHSCRNRNCVAPHHLAEKTRIENNGADKIRDGVDNGGERCHFSKLTETDVKRIRKLYNELGMRISALARTFAVTSSCISAIVHGKTWKPRVDETTVSETIHEGGQETNGNI